jgi:hypothetical protein
MGEERGFYRVLVGKPEGKRPLGRHRRRWVDNLRMDLQEVGCGFMDWIGLAQDRDRWRTLVSAVMRWAGHVARMGEERGVYRVLVGKPEGKRPLGRHRRRWVDNIKMDLQEVGCGVYELDWAGPG